MSPSPPPTSIREQIMVAVVTALAVASASCASGSFAKPSNLTVHRERTRPIETDMLPAVMVYADDDVPKPTGHESYRAPLTERQLSLTLECRAQGSANVSPDEALDPILIWAALALFADETFGGLANGLEESRTVWSSRQGDVPVASTKFSITVKFRTSRLDPTSKS